MPMPRSYSWLKEGETCRYCIGSGAALGGRCKHCGGLGKTFQGKPREPCPDCDGQGKSKTVERCPTCEGKGWQDLQSKPSVACRFCMGSGKTVGGACKHCGGIGRMDLDKDGKEIDLILLMAQKQQKCPMCLGLGYRARGATCDACHGTGFKEGPAPAPAATSEKTPAAAPGALLPGPKPAPVVTPAPPVSQGNPLEQSKFGAARFCMGCGTGIKPGAEACPRCGKPVNPPSHHAPAPAAPAAAPHPHGSPHPAAATAHPPPHALFGPPQYCKSCGTGFKSGITACPKCGKPAPAPSA